MRILVTGGTGFTGLHLVRRLLSRGHTVTALDLERTPAAEALEREGASLIIGSVTDADLVDHASRGQDLVFHLASAFREIYGGDQLYWNVDVTGTRGVLEAARRHGVRRVVHVSTQGVHGIVAEAPGDEDSPIAPQDYYCYAKYEGERVCREFIDSGMDIVIARPTSIYGPGDTHGWLKLFRMINQGRFLMVGSGETMNHPVYVENLVDGLELAATVPGAAGRTYLLGDERHTTLNELISQIAETLGVELRVFRFPSYRVAWAAAAAVEFACKPFGISPPIFRRRLSWFRTNRAFRIDRAKAELGYRPAIELREGLKRTAIWYRQQGLLDSGAVAVDANPRDRARAAR
jgi:nucleoside-diphosphate-sugar epimerase